MQQALIILYYILTAYYYVIIAAILLSWIQEIRQTAFYQFLRRLTDPYLNVFRGFLVVGMIDLTPIFGLLLYQFALRSLVQIINGL